MWETDLTYNYKEIVSGLATKHVGALEENIRDLFPNDFVNVLVVFNNFNGVMAAKPSSDEYGEEEIDVQKTYCQKQVFADRCSKTGDIHR